MNKKIIEYDFPKGDYNASVKDLLSDIGDSKIVFIFSKNKFKGVISKRDLLRFSIANPDKKITKLIRMPPNVHEKTTDEELAHYFIESGLHKLPYFEKNIVVGAVDRIKFLNEVVSKKMEDIKVEDVATYNVLNVSSKDSLSFALNMIKENSVSKLVVYDKKIRGVITLPSILNFFRSSKTLNPKNLRSTKVREVMKEKVYGVYLTDPVSKAINLFKEDKTSSLVVYSKKKILGVKEVAAIVTKTDILSKYLASLKKGRLKLTITSKIDKLDRDLVSKKIDALDKIIKKNSKVFVYLKEGKEKFRGMPLINVRLRVVMPKVSENISAEGWGIEHALELAISKIKRRLKSIEF